MSAIDLPPGIGLVGTPLGVFVAPRRAKWLSTVSVVASLLLGVVVWYLVSLRPWRHRSGVAITLPVAFTAVALLGFAIRRARIAVTRDGVRWGWSMLGFHQPATRIACAHIYDDGITLEAKRGSWWFLGARDWDRYDALVRQMRRTELPIKDHAGRAPLRARLQSYGRFLDGLLVGAALGSFAVVLWVV